VGVPPVPAADRALARPRNRPLVALLAVGAGVLVDLRTSAAQVAGAGLRPTL
jgi:hypothetical protein